MPILTEDPYEYAKSDNQISKLLSLNKDSTRILSDATFHLLDSAIQNPAIDTIIISTNNSNLNRVTNIFCSMNHTAKKVIMINTDANHFSAQIVDFEGSSTRHSTAFNPAVYKLIEKEGKLNGDAIKSFADSLNPVEGTTGIVKIEKVKLALGTVLEDQGSQFELMNIQEDKINKMFKYEHYTNTFESNTVTVDLYSSYNQSNDDTHKTLAGITEMIHDIDSSFPIYL